MWYLIQELWVFLLIALMIGIVVGWLSHDPKKV
jgi:hypothetical protein